MASAGQPELDESKASAIILENSRAGRIEELIVRIDDRRLGEKLLREVDLIYSQNGVSEDSRSRRRDEAHARYKAEMNKIKNEVFPNGQLGETKVIGSIESGPEVIVKTPTYDSLIQLLSNPMVVKVFQNNSIFPARLKESLHIPRTSRLARAAGGAILVSAEDGAALATIVHPAAVVGPVLCAAPPPRWPATAGSAVWSPLA